MDVVPARDHLERSGRHARCELAQALLPQAFHLCLDRGSEMADWWWTVAASTTIGIAGSPGAAARAFAQPAACQQRTSWYCEIARWRQEADVSPRDGVSLPACPCRSGALTCSLNVVRALARAEFIGTDEDLDTTPFQVPDHLVLGWTVTDDRIESICRDDRR
ncbi:MAG: hypothetical protein QOD50_376 [Actinomycetota bacterium]|nr:hypothetical protein [Actinomycetota bacterium]